MNQHLPDHPAGEEHAHLPDHPAGEDHARLPDHPAAREEYAHLQETMDAVDREIREVEFLTKAKAGEHSVVHMQESVDLQDEVALQRFRYLLDRLRQLAMAAGQAYFSRLDFIPEGRAPETWYLGRWGVLNPDTLEPVVVDWRSPVANLYYSGQIGPMDYEAPDGTVKGELTLKRMLTVQGRELLSLFDSGVVSQEEYLQEVLGSVSTDRLRDIVTTIQAEQNNVIRHPLSPHLMVQGAAGSGKTTIALHRIAYLLYTLRDSMGPESMMILAPNPLFLSYISQVLPDLGVERVIQTTFEGWCRECMGKRMPKLLREGRLEKNLNASREERERAGRVSRLKGSMDTLARLDRFLEELQNRLMPEKELKMAGVMLIDRKELEDILLRQFRFYPLETRITELKKIYTKRVRAAEEKLKARYGEAAENQINRVMAQLPDNPARLEKIRGLYDLRDQRYREIEERARLWMGHFRDLFPALNLKDLYGEFLREAGQEDIMADTLALLEKGAVRQEDLPLLLLICRRVFGIRSQPLRHIVIDECQDFSPLQLALLRRCFPAATFTLVGDLYQGIHADEGIRSWEEWTGPVFEGQADLKQLTVSYRNTVEIMELARSVARRYPVAGVQESRPVLRHGQAPEIIPAGSEKELQAKLTEQIRAWQREGFHSIALIEKTAERAKALHRRMGKEWGARLLTEDDAEYQGGVLILSAGLVKGMEFDCVALCNVSEDLFPEDEFLCRVLYVMMTRPLHRLTLFHTGHLTPLLG